MGQADAALVEHDQIARGRDRAEQVREVFGERDRRLARARPRARSIASCASPTGRAVAAHRQRDRARRRPARVQRHRQMPAGVFVAVRRTAPTRSGAWASARSTPPERTRARRACEHGGEQSPASRIVRNLSLWRQCWRARRVAPRGTVSRSPLETRDAIAAPGAPPAIGPYSHAVQRRRAAVLLGPDPARPEHRRARRGDRRRAGAPLPGEPASRVRGRGTTLERAVRLTVYMTDLAQFAEVNEVYGRSSRDDPPARVTVGVAAAAEGRSGRDRRGACAL